MFRTESRPRNEGSGGWAAPACGFATTLSIELPTLAPDSATDCGHPFCMVDLPFAASDIPLLV